MPFPFQIAFRLCEMPESRIKKRIRQMIILEQNPAYYRLSFYMHILRLFAAFKYVKILSMLAFLGFVLVFFLLYLNSTVVFSVCGFKWVKSL